MELVQHNCCYLIYQFLPQLVWCVPNNMLIIAGIKMSFTDVVSPACVNNLLTPAQCIASLKINPGLMLCKIGNSKTRFFDTRDDRIVDCCFCSQMLSADNIWDKACFI